MLFSLSVRMNSLNKQMIFVARQRPKARPAELRGQVSAAMLFATARFNTWVAANNFKDGNEMRDAKDQVMSYLLQQFQMMLEDNFDEYCEQFDNYLRFRKNEDFHTHKHDH